MSLGNDAAHAGAGCPLARFKPCHSRPRKGGGNGPDHHHGDRGSRALHLLALLSLVTPVGCGSSTVSGGRQPACPEAAPYLWSDNTCRTTPETEAEAAPLPDGSPTGCPQEAPYLWSDGFCRSEPEFPTDRQPGSDFWPEQGTGQGTDVADGPDGASSGSDDGGPAGDGDAPVPLTLLGSLPLDLGEHPRLAADRGRLYVTGVAGLFVIDITNPAEPVVIDSYTPTPSYCPSQSSFFAGALVVVSQGLVVHGTCLDALFPLALDGTLDAPLVIDDYEKHLTPVEGVYVRYDGVYGEPLLVPDGDEYAYADEPVDAPFARILEWDGNGRLYYRDGLLLYDGWQTLDVYEFRPPSTFALLGSTPVDNISLYDLALCDTCAVLTGGETTVVDLSNPQEPHVTYSDSLTQGSDVECTGQYAFLADDGVSVYRITEQKELEHVETVPAPFTRDRSNVRRLLRHQDLLISAGAEGVALFRIGL